MESLSDILLREGVRERLVEELSRTIDDEVAAGRGLVGVAVRNGYRMVLALRRELVRDALDDLLEGFVDELDPLYHEHGSPREFARFLVTHRTTVAARMLRVTDARRDTSRSASLRSAYDALSPLALSCVERAVPRIALVLQRFVNELSPAEPSAEALPA